MEPKILDIHSHILPGVDDGAMNYEEADALLEAQIRCGVTYIFLTPHLRKGMFEVENEEIYHVFEQYKQHAEKKYPTLTLYIGREYFADSHFLALLERDDVIKLGDSNCVLVEFSRGHNYKYIRNFCYQILQKNLRPVIAHAERYPVLLEEKKLIQELLDLGAYVQINAASILGKSGWKTKRFCAYLLKKNYITFVASDCHNVSERAPNMDCCIKYIERKKGKDYVLKLMYDRPCKILIER